MGTIGAPEILVVLVAALIFLGPKRLPDAARQVGRAMAELRRMSSELQAEVRDAFDETAAPDRAEPEVIDVHPLETHELDVVEPLAPADEPAAEDTTREQPT